jgi:pilin isopeptide linkage protein/LPXTG-motif cell wall-anchored protein
MGHDVVAAIAEQNLSRKAKKAIDKILEGKSIVYYASWMDNIQNSPEWKGGYDKTKTWHYCNVDKGYTYDTTVYNLTVSVTEGEDGKLVKEETVTANGGSAGDIVFTNVYEEEEPEPAPKTGDNAPTAMALLALLASGAALVLLRQRRKEER